MLNTRLTNLGVIKNPSFSGNLSYGGKANYENGMLQVHICSNMGIFKRIMLFRSLQKQKFRNSKNAVSLSTRKILVKAKQKFCVEFDGEVIRTDNLRFGIHQKYIQVCK